MQFPVVATASALFQAVPLMAAAAARRPPRGAMAWIVTWCALNFLETAAMFALALRDVHNLWVPYLFEPLEGATLLWAFSCWQEGEVARLTMRLAIVPFVGVLVIVSLFLETTTFFSRAVGPLTSLVGLYAAASTLIAKSRVSTGDVLRQEWLWVGAGFALYFAVHSMVGPLSALLVGDLPLFNLAYNLAAVLDVAAFLAIAWGFRCAPDAREAAALLHDSPRARRVGRPA